MDVTSNQVKGRKLSVQRLLNRIKFLETKLFDAEMQLNGIIDCKLAEQKALQANEERYRQIFMRSPAVKLIVDPLNGKIINANQAAAEFYGYTIEELINMEIFEINPSPPEKTNKNMVKICADNAGKLYYLKHKLRNGTLRDVEVYAGPVTVGDRTLVNAIVFDVTDRKKMEEELRESRERLSLVVEGAKAGIWDWDMITNRVFHDKQWKAILGYEEHEANGGAEEWQGRWHPDDILMIRQTMQDYLQGKTAKYELEYRLQHKDGSYRWIYTAGKITRDTAGRPIRWVGFNIDITDRKQVEEIVRESEKKLRDFAQAVPDASFIIDEDGRHIEVFNSHNHQLFRPREELIGLTLHQIYLPEQADMLLNKIRQTILSGMPQYDAQELEFGKGVKRWIEARLAPMTYLANGKKTVAIVANDITERKHTDRILQSTYELQRKSDFINAIINGVNHVDSKAISFAGTFGLDLTRPLFCCLIVSEIFTVNSNNEYGAGHKPLKLKSDIINALYDEPQSIVWLHREDIGIIYQPANLKEASREHAARIANRIRDKISDVTSGLPIMIGVGTAQTGPESLYKSFQQAWSAVMSARSEEGNTEGVYYFWNLGVFQLLAGYGGKERARDFVEEKIGKLIAYDSKKETDFLATLEKILQSANLKEVAEEMFLHHKTIVNRKQRIEKILGISLDQFETRLAIATAIKLHKLNTQLAQR